MMEKPYTLYGWHLSYFTGKVRAYLKYKKIPYLENSMNFYTLMVLAKKKTGASTMPILRTPNGTWISDTSDIIDALEASHSEFSIIPRGAKQRFAAYLIEAWADEWWVPIAMHTRWNYPENYALFEAEAGSNLLPHFPKFMQKMMAAKIAKMLRGMLPSVGVRQEQISTMENWSLQMLDHLDAHFALHPYLFGERPCLADFALMGPMYGHLGRDPWPAREWIASRANLRTWIDRMAEPEKTNIAMPSDRYDDTIPETLTPIFGAIFSEFIPMLQAINEQVHDIAKDFEHGRTLPRALGEITFPMGQSSFSRSALPFSLWMAQRALNIYKAMPKDEQITVHSWLISRGGVAFLNLDIPKLKRVNVRVAIER